MAEVKGEVPQQKLMITLFGRPCIYLEGEEVTGFVSNKASALIYYLAVTRQPCSRHKLAGLLWGDFTEQKARKNLRDVLSNLRQILGPYLIINRNDVSLNGDAPIEIDVESVDFTIQDVERLVSSYLSPAKVALLTEVVELYQGEFLEGFHIAHAPDFEIWQVAERARYQNLAIRALHSLTEYATRQGNTTLGLKYATELLVLEPWHEETHRQIMKLLVWSGQRSAALAQFEACRRILADNFGVEPEFETRQLYERILRGDLILTETTMASDAPPIKPFTHNLPSLLTPFLGREAELVDVIDRLRDPGCRLLTLVGPGGVGKTRLAIQAAQTILTDHGVEKDYSDGVYFVRLASVENPELDVSKHVSDEYNPVAATIADAFDLSLTDPDAPVSRLLNYMREKRMLLLIDNFEHLLAYADYLAILLAAAPGVKMLVTSRVRLNLRGEQLFMVDGLPFPEEASDQASWEDYSAIQLFLQTARSVNPGFVVTSDEITAVNRICQLVDGLPLGIELAATWVRVLSCVDIHQELVKNLRFLNVSMRDVPERHRSLWAVITYSWNMLSAQQHQILRQLSVFRGGFTREAAAFVAEASLSDLSGLVDFSFIRSSNNRPDFRFEMLEIIRLYVAEQLQQKPAEGTAVFNRHCDYYLNFVQSYSEKLQNSDQRVALDALSVEMENIRVAWRWAVLQQDEKQLAKGLPGLFDYYDMRSRFQEGLDAFQRAVDAVKVIELKSVEVKILLGKLLARQGWFCFHVAKFTEAKDFLEQSVAMLRPLPDPYALIFSLNYRGAVYFHLEMIEAAKASCEEARQLSQNVEDGYGAGIALNILSQIAYREGDYDMAQLRGQESLAIVTKLDNPWSKAYSLSNLAQVAFACEDYEEVKKLSQTILSIREEMGDLRGMAMSLALLAHTAVAQHEFEEASDLYQRSLDIYREIGNQKGIVSSLIGLANTAEQQGNFGIATVNYTDALKRAIKINNLPELKEIGEGLLETIRAQGDIDKAQQLEKLMSVDSAEIRWSEAFDLIEA